MTMNRRSVSGKPGKHVTTFRRLRSPSRSPAPPNSPPNNYRTALARARARLRMRNAIAKILNEVRMRPRTGSMYRSAMKNFYQTAASMKPRKRM